MPPPALLSSRLAAAMSHPTRLRVMTVLVERTATPREIALEMGEPLNNVTYHIDVLKELECIDLVEVKQSQGGRVAEHFYRATEVAYIDADGWAELDASEKLDVTTGILRLASQDLNEAMAAGTFYDPDDAHLSRTPLEVDRQGWGEVDEVMDEALERLLRVKDKIADRCRRSDAETFLTKVHIFHFRSPSPKKA
jgi:DNA-binding transcriptional ArsR family regulator